MKKLGASIEGPPRQAVPSHRNKSSEGGRISGARKPPAQPLETSLFAAHTQDPDSSPLPSD